MSKQRRVRTGIVETKLLNVCFVKPLSSLHIRGSYTISITQCLVRATIYSLRILRIVSLDAQGICSQSTCKYLMSRV